MRSAKRVHACDLQAPNDQPHTTSTHKQRSSQCTRVHGWNSIRKFCPLIALYIHARLLHGMRCTFTRGDATSACFSKLRGRCIQARIRPLEHTHVACVRARAPVRPTCMNDCLDARIRTRCSLVRVPPKLRSQKRDCVDSTRRGVPLTTSIVYLLPFVP